ncbi:MAG: hypothetical protein IKD00_04170 [Candidatus Methanomethylophilaceae archaeon]|nr:hypothetical protein [Candidatus Methanomethylophilaceae archaeon]
MKSNSFSGREILLLLSLMLFAFIPSINQLVIDGMVINAGSDVLTIAAQIEWFDLFNETILAFLTVPLYFILNKSKDDRDLSNRINITFIPGFLVYATISLTIYLYASNLTAYMNSPDGTLEYLRMETVGFLAGFISSYMYIVFVVRGKYPYFVCLLLAKVLMLSIGNATLIPEAGATGIAMTNILVNVILSMASIVLLYREGLVRRAITLDRTVLHDWVKTGLFSGGQILLANIVYMMVVMKMINNVSQVGDYWLANNFIWGWLLIPMMAIGEMVKREYVNGYSRIWNYLLLTALVIALWLVSIPLWGVMFDDVLRVENSAAILNVLYKLVPFYVFYAFSVVLQGVLISVGRTDYLLMESAVVNLVYYGIMYGLYLMGVFEASLDFAIILFGFGMIVCLVLDLFFYRRSKNVLNITVR